MALEFISSEKIDGTRRIPIPRRANCYRTKSGEVRFFRLNSELPDWAIKIPRRSREIEFEGYQRCVGSITYGRQRFYDREGKVIKVKR